VTLGVVNRPAGSLFVDLGNNAGSFSWTPSFAQQGSYTVSFTGRDDLGAEAAPKLVAMTVDNVNRGPVAVAGGPYAGVVNVALAFDGTGASDPDGDILTYEWNFGDLASGSGPNPLHAYATGGVFTVNLSVHDASLSASALTTATIQAVFPATAFLDGGNRTTRLNSGKAETCVQIEPVERAYVNSGVLPSSIVMISPGTGVTDRISAIDGKTTIGADRDRNGVDELTACFAKPELRRLFGNLSGGRHTVGVTLEGALATGGVFRTTLELDVVVSGNALAASVSPNPLNPVGVLSFKTSRPGAVTVAMFDPAGRLVRTLLREPFVDSGYHDAAIDGRRDDGARLPSGVYFYKIESVEGAAMGRIVLLK
jgi:PKD repeat protein